MQRSRVCLSLIDSQTETAIDDATYNVLVFLSYKTENILLVGFGSQSGDLGKQRLALVNTLSIGYIERQSNHSRLG